MQKIIFFLFCLSANAAFAQMTDYEFTVIVPLDEFSIKKADKTDTLQALHTVLFAPPDMQQYQATPFYNALRKQKNQNWFADKNCTKPIRIDFKLCDTLLKDGKFFGASCNEEIVSSERTMTYALRHVVKYNPTTQKMSAEIVAIAPIAIRYNTKGQKYNQYLGWLKLPANAKNVVENQNFAFAKRATLCIKNSDMQPTKIATPPLAQTLFEAAQQQKIKTYSDYAFKNAISAKDFAAIQIERVDTVVTYNPETYEEQIKIVRNEGIKSENIYGLRFNFLYNFDEKTFTFTSKIESIGIEEKNDDHKGTDWYHSSAFFIKPE